MFKVSLPPGYRQDSAQETSHYVFDLRILYFCGLGLGLLFNLPFFRSVTLVTI